MNTGTPGSVTESEKSSSDANGTAVALAVAIEPYAKFAVNHRACDAASCTVGVIETGATAVNKNKSDIIAQSDIVAQREREKMSHDNKDKTADAAAHETEPWFMGSMTREDAEPYLNTHMTVTSFVVRNSSHPGALLCLSQRLKSGEFAHTHISRVQAGWSMPSRGREVEARSVRQLLVTGFLRESSSSSASASSPFGS